MGITALSTELVGHNFKRKHRPSAMFVGTMSRNKVVKVLLLVMKKGHLPSRRQICVLCEQNPSVS